MPTRTCSPIWNWFNKSHLSCVNSIIMCCGYCSSVVTTTSLFLNVGLTSCTFPIILILPNTSICYIVAANNVFQADDTSLASKNALLFYKLIRCFSVQPILSIGHCYLQNQIFRQYLVVLQHFLKYLNRYLQIYHFFLLRWVWRQRQFLK